MEGVEVARRHRSLAILPASRRTQGLVRKPGWTVLPRWAIRPAHVATHRFTIDGKPYEVAVGVRSGAHVDVAVNGKTYRVEIGERAGTPPPVVPTRPAPAPVVPVVPRGPATAGEVRAPISGLVLSVEVTPGQQVTAGTVLLVVEAMKMENEIFAPCDGTVKSVAVEPQQEIAQGALLVTLG
jgi:glutaconyl-CoA decarboxylase